MFYTMRTAFLVLVLMTISACSSEMGVSLEPAEKPARQVETTQQPVASTTTTSSPYAESIIKDERTGIIPSSLEIPAIGLKTDVESVGIKENGEMAVTESFNTTGWFEKGYKPGEPGNAVIGGHVDSRNGPAVFYELSKLTEGDEVKVTSKSGDTRTFIVTGKKEYPWDDAPLKTIFGYTHRSSLNLITCTGDFDRSARNYSKRLVIYTELRT
jgi:sortase (surface protein transpeptidase)